MLQCFESLKLHRLILPRKPLTGIQCNLLDAPLLQRLQPLASFDHSIATETETESIFIFSEQRIGMLFTI